MAQNTPTTDSDYNSIEEASSVIKELREEREVLIVKIHDLMVRLEESEKKRQTSFNKLLYDDVTGLPNQNKMDQDVGSLIWDFFDLPNPPQISLILIKLGDNFDQIKQAFTEDAFNEIIRTITERLKLMIGKKGILYRTQIDELAVFIFDSIPVQELIAFSYEIRDNIETTVDNQVFKVKIGCRIGIASFPKDALNSKMLFSSADIALSHAVGLGVDVVLFNEEMRHNIVGNLEMQNHLLSAIEVKTLLELSENFSLFFQPIVTVESIGEKGIKYKELKAEVLIRWKDPHRGSVLPRNLIEVAEDTGLILPIGRWLLKAAMLKLYEWKRDFFDIKLSINISPRQFYSSSFSDELDRLVKETKINPAHIYLEITETCLFNNQEYASNEIERLSNMGFKIALDDFGTGYSSLGYLNSFKADVLKIDRVFVEGLTEDGRKRELIKSIVQIGRELEMDVIFEGIEKVEQLKEAYKLGCRSFQGFLFSRPLSIDLFEKFMDNCKNNFVAFLD